MLNVPICQLEGVGGQNWVKLCPRSFWMAPKSVIMCKLDNDVTEFACVLGACHEHSCCVLAQILSWRCALCFFSLSLSSSALFFFSNYHTHLLSQKCACYLAIGSILIWCIFFDIRLDVVSFLAKNLEACRNSFLIVEKLFFINVKINECSRTPRWLPHRCTSWLLTTY